MDSFSPLYNQSMTRQTLLNKLEFLEVVARQIKKELTSMNEQQGSTFTGEIGRKEQLVSRPITDTQRLKFSFDYVFLSEREIWLNDELVRLKKKYQELVKEINRELDDVQQQMLRYRLAVRYGIIEEPQLIDPDRASAGTSMFENQKPADSSP